MLTYTWPVDVRCSHILTYIAVCLLGCHTFTHTVRCSCHHHLYCICPSPSPCRACCSAVAAGVLLPDHCVPHDDLRHRAAAPADGAEGPPQVLPAHQQDTHAYTQLRSSRQAQKTQDPQTQWLSNQLPEELLRQLAVAQRVARVLGPCVVSGPHGLWPVYSVRGQCKYVGAT